MTSEFGVSSEFGVCYGAHAQWISFAFLLASCTQGMVYQVGTSKGAYRDVVSSEQVKDEKNLRGKYKKPLWNRS